MTTYTLNGEKGRQDISFTINDLIPVKHQKKYSYDELVRLIDYTYYQFNNQSFCDGYKLLYKQKENKKVDFFKIRGTDLIVIPGNHIYPTTLKETDIQ